MCARVHVYVPYYHKMYILKLGKHGDHYCIDRITKVFL